MIHERQECFSPTGDRLRGGGPGVLSQEAASEAPSPQRSHTVFYPGGSSCRPLERVLTPSSLLLFPVRRCFSSCEQLPVREQGCASALALPQRLDGADTPWL